MTPFSSGPTAFLAPSPIWWQILHLANTFSPSAGSPAAWARPLVPVSSTAPAKSAIVPPMDIGLLSQCCIPVRGRVRYHPTGQGCRLPGLSRQRAKEKMVSLMVRLQRQASRWLQGLRLAAFVSAALLVVAPAHAAERLRIAVQKTGTLAWEIGVIRAQGLDTEADLDLQVVDVASLDAAIIALRSGAADII